MKKKKKFIGSVFLLEVIALVIILLYAGVYFKGMKEDGALDPAKQTIARNSANVDTEDTQVISEADNTQEQAAGPEEDMKATGVIGEGDTSEGDIGEGYSGEGDIGEGDAGNTEDTQNSEDGTEAGNNGGSVTPGDVFDTITISAAGDVTLGRDSDYGYTGSFDDEFELQGKDYGYFFRNVKAIFEADDLTIVNLETTLTKAKDPAVKKFRFKADPSYVEILKQGDIEVVSVANNHSLDYLEQGYDDTIATLKEAGVGYFGFDNKYITDIRGIKLGILGYECWKSSQEQKDTISQDIKGMKEEGADLVIVMFHWGIERDYYPYSVQTEIAHFTIDSGADLVLGSHPHVLQGIEEYHGKNIFYSLGNFSFGGNKNPADKDTMVVVYKFNFKNGELVSHHSEVVPCSISSVKDRNNYQPTPLKDSELARVIEKINKYSVY